MSRARDSRESIEVGKLFTYGMLAVRMAFILPYSGSDWGREQNRIVRGKRMRWR